MVDGRAFLDREILPLVYARLDEVFPEFGWQRTRQGWVATNGNFTRSKFAARPDRVVCKEQGGFLIYGDKPVHWLEYLCNGTFPRGAEWWQTVSALAVRVGLPPPEAGHKGLRERAIEALGDALTRTERAASYLRARGVHQLGELGELTVEPTEVLLAAGFSRAEIEKAGVVRDLRFVGRLCCVWRDENGRARSLWGRSLNGEEPKYLVLAGEVPPLFAADTGLLAARRGRRPEGVLVVEGMMDPLSLREAGFEHVVAVGRAGVSPEALERLEAVGGATLCLDADAAGVAGLWRAVDAWARSRSPVKLFVASIEGAKDPDELVRQHGASALQRAIDARVPAASAWVERASAAATTEAELFAVAGRAVSFLADVALCHPLEAAAASELLAKRGINGAMLKLATRSLPREELLRVRESLARRLAEVDALLMEP